MRQLGYPPATLGVTGVLAGLCVALVGLVGPASPAHADGGNDLDAAFLTTLDEAGIEYTTPQEALAVGREVCDYLAAGHPPHAAARALRISNHQLGVGKAAHFVTFARSAFCPAGLAETAGLTDTAGLAGAVQEGPR